MLNVTCILLPKKRLFSLTLLFLFFLEFSCTFTAMDICTSYLLFDFENFCSTAKWLETLITLTLKKYACFTQFFCFESMTHKWWKPHCGFSHNKPRLACTRLINYSLIVVHSSCLVRKCRLQHFLGMKSEILFRIFLRILLICRKMDFSAKTSRNFSACNDLALFVA